MRNDDPDHFQVLVQRYRNQVYGLVASILGPDNEAEIEDVVQDVFISVYSKIRSFRNDCPFSSWVLTIARNRAIDHLRKTCRGPLYFGNEQIYDLLSENPVPDSAVVASARERRNIVLRCFGSYPSSAGPPSIFITGSVAPRRKSPGFWVPMSRLSNRNFSAPGVNCGRNWR